MSSKSSYAGPGEEDQPNTIATSTNPRMSTVEDQEAPAGSSTTDSAEEEQLKETNRFPRQRQTLCDILEFTCRNGCCRFKRPKWKKTPFCKPPCNPLYEQYSEIIDELCPYFYADPNCNCPDSRGRTHSGRRHSRSRSDSGSGSRKRKKRLKQPPSENSEVPELAELNDNPSAPASPPDDLESQSPKHLSGSKYPSKLSKDTRDSKSSNSSEPKDINSKPTKDSKPSKLPKPIKSPKPSKLPKPTKPKPKIVTKPKKTGKSSLVPFPDWRPPAHRLFGPKPNASGFSNCCCECDPYATLKPSVSVTQCKLDSQQISTCSCGTEIILSSPPSCSVLLPKSKPILIPLRVVHESEPAACLSGPSVISLLSQVKDMAKSISVEQKGTKCTIVWEPTSKGVQTYIEEASQACPSHFASKIVLTKDESETAAPESCASTETQMSDLTPTATLGRVPSKVRFSRQISQRLINKVSNSQTSVPSKQVQARPKVQSKTIQTASMDKIKPASKTSIDQASSPGPSNLKVNSLYRNPSGHFNTPNTSSTTVISSRSNTEMGKLPLRPATSQTTPARKPMSIPVQRKEQQSNAGSQPRPAPNKIPVRPKTAQESAAVKPTEMKWKKQQSPSAMKSPEFQQRSLMQCIPWPELRWNPFDNTFHLPDFKHVKTSQGQFMSAFPGSALQPSEEQPSYSCYRPDEVIEEPENPALEHFRSNLPSFKLPPVPWQPPQGAFTITSSRQHTCGFDLLGAKSPHMSYSREETFITDFKNPQARCPTISFGKEIWEYPRRISATCATDMNLLPESPADRSPGSPNSSPSAPKDEENEYSQGKLFKLTQDLYNLVATAIRKSSLEKIHSTSGKDSIETNRFVQSASHRRSNSSIGKVNVGVNACKKKDFPGSKIIFHGKNSIMINEGKIKSKHSSAKRARSKKSLVQCVDASRKRSIISKDIGKKRP